MIKVNQPPDWIYSPTNMDYSKCEANYGFTTFFEVNFYAVNSSMPQILRTHSRSLIGRMNQKHEEKMKKINQNKNKWLFSERNLSSRIARDVCFI